MKFIDLFSGLGGFHLALSRLGHVCVLASEIDPELATLYKDNFGVEPVGDIRLVPDSAIPDHDILCAGFPCQPFSKAGAQGGFNDLERGGLFYEIIRIVRAKKPRFLILENVPNLRRHDGGATWRKLERALEREGYHVDDEYYSPHHFGVPQNRERVFIVADRFGLDGFLWPQKSNLPTSIESVLDTNPPDGRAIPAQVALAMNVWQEFLDQFPAEEELPSFPIWGMEFGATYPFDESTPFSLGAKTLRESRGVFGTSFAGLTPEQILDLLPSYAKTPQVIFPRWKRTFIRQNRALYERHKPWIDPWKEKLKLLPPSLQKFEWNAKGETRQVSQHVLQVRASGLRVKRRDTSPSLVAMTATQVPIVAWEGRYMTKVECARLQSMENIRLPNGHARAYTALGNAVNTKVVAAIAEALLTSEAERRPIVEFATEPL